MNRAILIAIYSMSLIATSYSKILLYPSFSAGASYFKELSPEFKIESDYKLNIAFEGAIDFYINKYLSFQISIGYTPRGGIYTSNDSLFDTNSVFLCTSTSTWKHNLEYVTLPFGIRGMLPIGKFCLYGTAGGNLGFLARAKGDVDLETNPNIFNVHKKDEDIKKLYKNIDFGIDCGGGFEINIGRFVPFLEYIYYFGLMKIESADMDNGISSSGISLPLPWGHNYGMQIRGGLRIKI